MFLEVAAFAEKQILLVVPLCGAAQVAPAFAGVQKAGRGASKAGDCPPEPAAWGCRPVFPPAEDGRAYPAWILERDNLYPPFGVAGVIPAGAAPAAVGFPVEWFAAPASPWPFLPPACAIRGCSR